MGDRLYGLGACDIKAGLCAIIYAATTAKGKVKLLLCSDEENISKGVWKVLWGSRSWFRGVSIMVSGEPGASSIGVGGTDMVTVGRRGRVVFNIDVQGSQDDPPDRKRRLSTKD
ncbi:MAG: hypothetical protein KGH61_01960 [Candidatus Micrarchaeota archaeon]|nr:hypothetical protein [Candidatus Micrarchaeota archaeon]MDE1847695.1 hypothetical protein [Candidatus Micrarchaeota archaeon]MDE1864124.1 hypothetical protein [Candidatus Micrarchaeota archaeon]